MLDPEDKKFDRPPVIISPELVDFGDEDEEYPEEIEEPKAKNVPLDYPDIDDPRR